MPEGNVQLHCPGICRHADDWTVLSVSGLYSANETANGVSLQINP